MIESTFTFYIFVSGKKSNPFKEQKNLFKISIQDKEVEIKITKSIFNKQKKPYSNCDFVEDDDDGNFVYPSLFDRKYYDQIKQAGYDYSHSMCISFCQLDKIGNNCSLRASSINAPNNLDINCPHYNIYDLLDYNFISDWYAQYFINEEVDKECKAMCPIECVSENFDLFLTRIKQRNMSDDSILGGSRVALYFDSVSYLNYEESPSISVNNLILAERLVSYWE